MAGRGSGDTCGALECCAMCCQAGLLQQAAGISQSRQPLPCQGAGRSNDGLLWHLGRRWCL